MTNYSVLEYYASYCIANQRKETRSLNKKFYLAGLLVYLTTFFYFDPISTALLTKSPTLRDKIGQMLIIGFHGKTLTSNSAIAHAIDQGHIGGVILFDYNVQSQTFDNNISSPAQVRRLNLQLQQRNTNAYKLHHRSYLPLIISVDYEGGQVNRLAPQYGFPSIPSPASVGKNTLAAASTIASIMATNLETAGFTLDFSPLLDIAVNEKNPIIAKLQRSYSAFPSQIMPYAQIYSNAFSAHGIQCAYKHFPGHGSSLGDSHLGFADITNTWTNDELMPYMQVLAQPEHCQVIMVGHLVNRQLDATGLPASLSYAMINGVLRHDLHFNGVVVTDDMQMKAITEHYGLEKALTLSINAGVDLLIFGNQLVDKQQDPEQLIDIIEHQVATGQIPKSRINEAYNRIQRLKQNKVLDF